MVTPSLDELHAFLVANFYNTFRNDPNGLPNVSEESFNWKWLRTFAAGAAGNFANLSALISDLWPNTAEGELLRRWATARGLVPKAATGARKSKGLRVFGTPGTTVPALLELTHASGLRFQATSSDVIGPGGQADLDIAAISTGAATRLSAGEDVTFTGALPAGLEEAAKIVLAMDEDGNDAELDGSLQARLAKRFSDPPRGGSIADWVAWATDVTGIAAAFVYPVRKGWGNVDVAALHAGTGSDRMLSAPEVADLYNALNLRRPVGMKGFRVLNTFAEPNNAEYLYLDDGDPSHARDWDDSTPPTVSAWDAVARKVTLAVRPDSMKPGDRMTFPGGATGRERVIDTLESTDSVILTVDEDGDVPTPTQVAYSGGPLVQPIRAAIIALGASLGTANPDAKRYGTWDGNLRPNAVSRVSGLVPGVLDGTVIAPSSVVEASDPEYPDDGSVGLIVLARVLVRAAA